MSVWRGISTCLHFVVFLYRSLSFTYSSNFTIYFFLLTSATFLTTISSTGLDFDSPSLPKTELSQSLQYLRQLSRYIETRDLSSLRQLIHVVLIVLLHPNLVDCRL
jgi:hypothetical protein